MKSHPSTTLELVVEHNTPVAAIVPERVGAEQLQVIYAIVRGLNRENAFNHPELAERWNVALVITTDDWASEQLRRQPMLKPKTARLQFLSEPGRAAGRENFAVKNLTISEQIIGAVSNHFGVSIAQLEGPLRQQEISWPRFCAMALIKTHTTLTVEKIGILFNRDHGTVCHAVDALSSRVETDRKFAAEYAKLESVITDLLSPAHAPNL